MKPFAMAALLLGAAAPLAAQGRRAAQDAEGANVQRAVATITEDDYRQRIGVIADDSMRGRGTPSPELDQVAAWIAAQFQSFGLRPGGDNGTFFQRYPIRRTQLDTTSFVMAMGRGAHGHWVLGKEAATGFRAALAEGDGNGLLALMVGTPTDTVNPFAGASVAGAVILQVAPALTGRGPGGGGGGGAPMAALLRRAREAGVVAWISLTPQPGDVFRLALNRSLEPAVTLMQDGPPPAPGVPVFTVRDSSAADLLRAAGEDIAALRGQTTFSVRLLPGFSGAFHIHFRTDQQVTAPNVIGVLEGSDPVLKNEYLFFTGHMDHVGVAGMGNGCTAVGADSICNGADDDASGTTGVVMLAQAFSRMRPRPRRTLVFMTVSGEERGLWGSQWYATHPLLPLASTVADLNMDMIGRYFDNRIGWRDTIAVIGKEHSSLGAVANRVTQEHPDLHMSLVDDIWPGQRFYFRSDHYNFARRGVPILFFFNGTHPDYHRVSDSVDKIDAEKASRIVKMVFYVGLEVANATERPQWNPESRRQIVDTGN